MKQVLADFLTSSSRRRTCCMTVLGLSMASRLSHVFRTVLEKLQLAFDLDLLAPLRPIKSIHLAEVDVHSSSMFFLFFLGASTNWSLS